MPATRMDLGDIAIHRIVETEQPLFQPLVFFPTLGAERLADNLGWLQPRYIDPASGKLIMSVQSYLVVTPHHKILIDSCVGNHKPRPGRPFWDMQTSPAYENALSATGIGVGDIDDVMCTHLHVDHVGWNTRLDNGRWVPTFPNAKYLFSGTELDFWTRRNAAEPATCPWITDSVLPIVAARREQLIASDHVLDDRVRLLPTPGHTIDHFSVEIGRRDASAIVTGDMVHSPIQMRYPELGMMADYDSAQGGATRRRLFERICDTPTLLCTAHFPQPSSGRVGRWGDGFKFIESAAA